MPVANVRLPVELITSAKGLTIDEVPLAKPTLFVFNVNVGTTPVTPLLATVIAVALSIVMPDAFVTVILPPVMEPVMPLVGAAVLPVFTRNGVVLLPLAPRVILP